MRMKLRSIRAAISGSAPTALALAALALAGCSETLAGPSARVAEIAPDTTGADDRKHRLADGRHQAQPE